MLLLRLTVPVAILTITAAPLAQSPTSGSTDAIVGAWDLTVEGADGRYPSWLEVSRTGTEFSGRFVGRVGSARPVSSISFRDGELLIRIAVQYEQNKSDLIFKGRVAGERLEGTSEDAAGRTIKWTAVRAPALDRRTTPKWGRSVDLFNGKDLTGWKLRDQRRGQCWSVENGAMTNQPPCVDIITDRGFDDFRLHVEFNFVPKSNSGLYLRGRYEVQIQDDFGKTFDNLGMGGVYGFVPPSMNGSGRPGDWQTCDVTLIGRRVAVVLNGRTIIDNVRIPGITGGALDSDEGAPGPLMLQGDHGKIAFRKVVITPAE
jgi:3-keto-disaccharide hydrolase